MFNGMLLATLATGAAHAETGLVWKWDDTTRKFRISSGTRMVEPLAFRTSTMMPFNAADVAVGLTCAPSADMGKKAWQMKCALDDLVIGLSANVPGQQEQLDGLVATVIEGLSGASVQFRLSRDGVVSGVELVDFDPQNKLVALNINLVETLIARPMGMLDLELPKDGDDAGKGEWKQKQSQLMTLPVEVSTMGMFKMTHTVKPADSGVTIATDARGVLEPSQVATGQTAGKKIETTLTCAGVFDKDAGTLVKRTCEANGELSASSAGSSLGLQYVYKAELELVP